MDRETIKEIIANLQRPELPAAEKDTLISQVENWHQSIFGPARKPLKLKLRDLESHAIINKISNIDESINDLVQTNYMIKTYYNDIFFAFAFRNTPYLLQIYDEKVVPSIMSRHSHFFKSASEATTALMAHRRYIASYRLSEHIQRMCTSGGLTEQQLAELYESKGELIENLDEIRPRIELLEYEKDKIRHNGLINLVSKLLSTITNESIEDYYDLGNFVYREEPPYGSDLLERGVVTAEEIDHVTRLIKYLHFRRTVTHTNNQSGNTTARKPHVTRGQCSFYGNEIDLSPKIADLKELIHRMENICKNIIDGHRNDGIMARTRFPQKVDVMRYNINTFPAEITDSDFMSIMNQMFPYKEHGKITPARTIYIKIRDQVASDAGGVTRAVIYGLGEYLKKTLKMANGLYYLCHADGSDLSSRMIWYIVQFLILVITTETKINMPLSYGILYCLTTLATKDLIEDVYYIPLECLMALYKLEAPDELPMLLNMITMTDDQMGEYLPQYPQSSQLPQDAEFNRETRLAWLRTVLRKKIFYPFSKDISSMVIFKNALNSKLYLLSRDETREFVEYMPIYNLPRVASYFKVPINARAMKDIPIVGTGNSATIAKNISYMKRYIKDNVGKAEAILSYIHGSVVLDKPIIISDVASGLPAAHTCSGHLDIRPYERYADFDREFTYAIENSVGLHLV